MPAKSKSQQKAAGAALAAKRGEQKVSDLKGPAKSMYESMSEGQLEEFASTKRKGKPEHAAKKKK
jgi:Zn/Cd-binding protein ZinT